LTAPGDDDKLSLCGVTSCPSDRGGEGWLRTFFVSLNGRKGKQKLLKVETFNKLKANRRKENESQSVGETQM